MWAVLLKKYADSPRRFTRIPKNRWISFTMDLETFSVPPQAERISLKRAGREDIEALRRHPEAGQNIVRSALNFWDVNGFRSMYLGYLGDDPEPAVFQYALDDSVNAHYRKMTYGGMYLPQSPASVQVENLYAFNAKRRKNTALDFEWALFGVLKNAGKKLVRTHIGASNHAAIKWAQKVGLAPDAWITMVKLELPVLRMLKPLFVYTPVRARDYDQGPLAVYKRSQMQRQVYGQRQSSASVQISMNS